MSANVPTDFLGFGLITWTSVHKSAECTAEIWYEQTRWLICWNLGKRWTEISAIHSKTEIRYFISDAIFDLGKVIGATCWASFQFPLIFCVFPTSCGRSFGRFRCRVKCKVSRWRYLGILFNCTLAVAVAPCAVAKLVFTILCVYRGVYWIQFRTGQLTAAPFSRATKKSCPALIPHSTEDRVSGELVPPWRRFYISLDR